MEAGWAYFRGFDARRYGIVAVKPFVSTGRSGPSGRAAVRAGRELEEALRRAKGIDWRVVDGWRADLVRGGNFVVQMRHRSVGSSVRALVQNGVNDFVKSLELGR